MPELISVVATRPPPAAITTETAARVGPASGRFAAANRWAVTLAATAVSTWALDLVAAAAGVCSSRRTCSGGGVARRGARLPGSHVRGVGRRIAGQPDRQLAAPRGDGDEHQRVVQGAVRSRSTPIEQPAGGAGRLRRSVTSSSKSPRRRRTTPARSGRRCSATTSIRPMRSSSSVAPTSAPRVYEYGISRLTRTYLDGRSRRTPRSTAERSMRRHPPTPHSNRLGAAGVPERLLQRVEADERATIAFFVDAMRHAEPGQPVLLFGVGPTLHHVFLTAVTAAEIHLAEYLPANLHEIERWLAGAPEAHDWRPFVEYTLECEGVTRPDRGPDPRSRAAGPVKGHRVAGR